MTPPPHKPPPALPVAQSLMVEFKSDRARLPDHALVEALAREAVSGAYPQGRYGRFSGVGCQRSRASRLSRNLALADAMKRIGIVERSGRGVDKIYRGMLRFGRPDPDYSRTDQTSVILQLATVDADEVFLQMIVGQENRLDGTALPIDSLIALAVLREQKRLGTDELARHIHRDSPHARSTLARLVEAGMVQPHGNSRNRSYTLSAEVYQANSQQIAYTRQAGFSSLQHEQMVLGYVQHHGRIRRNEVIELCYLTENQAAKLLKRLKDEGRLEKSGERRWAFYTLSGGKPL